MDFDYLIILHMLQCTATTVFTKKTIDMVIYIMYMKADKCLPFCRESVSALSGRQRNILSVYITVKKSRCRGFHELFLFPLSFGECKLFGPLEL